MMDLILKEIEEGYLSLLEAPPEIFTDAKIVTKDQGTGKEEVTYLDNNLEWNKRYISLSPPRQVEALQAGVTAFLKSARLSSRLEANTVMTTMDEIITADITLMQRSPVFMSKYRRYVVVDSDKRSVPKNPYVQGASFFFDLVVNY